MRFPHLVTYSSYSWHYGVSTPRELAAAAAAQGATHLGLTDRDGLYGAVKHVRACLDAGVTPVLGADLALADPAGRKVVGRVVLLAEGHDAGAGYGDLCALVTRAHAPRAADGTVLDPLDPASPLGPSGTSGPAGSLDSVGFPDPAGMIDPAAPRTPLHPLGARPRLTAAEIARAVAAGQGRFVLLLGPESDVGRLAAARRPRLARAALADWKRLIGPERIRIHLVTHLTRPGEPRSTAHAARMLGLAEAAGVGAVLSNAARYATEDQAVTADLLDAARGLTSLVGPGTASDAPPGLDPWRVTGRTRVLGAAPAAPHLQPNGQGWLKDPAPMRALAAEVTAAAGGRTGPTRLLADTAALAERCGLDPAADLGLGTPVVPEAHLTGATETPAAELRARCEAGLHRLYGSGAAHDVVAPGLAPADYESPRARLDRELRVIENLGFCSYFLTVAHVSRLIGDLGIRHAARGSGVSSLVNYLLGVSVVDPLRHGLVFERFLSERRSTLPDIDIDVESARRHEIYRAVFDHYGPERVTLMSMHNGYRARGAVRDAARALGLPAETTDRIAKSIWRIPAGELRELIEVKPELAGLRREARENPAVNLLIDLVERLDRLPRHLSMHPCGVILSDAGLPRRTPVQPSGMGLPMSQYDKHDMDPMGLLKLDILGVRMQSAMAHTLDEIDRTTGARPDLEAIDTRDPATFALIQSTHTLGCFQIESPGQRELIGKLVPETVGDLIADISLFRPGPMQSDMVRPYLESRHGFAAPRYPHPDLVPYLEETSGVVIFHEQVIHLIATLTGCDRAEADEHRRSLGGPRQGETEGAFRAAALARGYAPETVEAVWGILDAFGSFGFCKAHGAAFAIPTYQSAWLKAHYPAHFLTGLLEHDPGMYPRRLLLAEARRLGVRLLPLDVNRSDRSYRAERLPDRPGAPDVARDWAVRLPLTQLSGIGEAEVQRILAHAPYTSAADLRDRARPRRPTLERLAAVGALDAAAFAGVDAEGADAARTPRPWPIQLALPLPASDQGLAPDRGTGDLAGTLRTELDLLELDVSAHLMAAHAQRLAAWPITRAADLLSLRTRTPVWVAGVRVSTMTPPMRSGRRVVFISLDDGTGCVDAAFFDEAQQLTGPELFGTPMLLIRGTTRRTGPRGISLTAHRAWDLTAILEGRAPAPFSPGDPARRTTPPPSDAARRAALPSADAARRAALPPTG